MHPFKKEKKKEIALGNAISCKWPHQGRPQWVDPFAEFNLEIRKFICIFYNFSTVRSHRWLKSFCIEDKDWFILHSQYSGCWLLGDVKRHGISNKDIDIVLTDILVSAPKGLTLCGLVMPYGHSGSILAQVMVCCLMAPNHYLNQCRLILISRVPQPSMTKIRLNITYLNFPPNLPGTNELIMHSQFVVNIHKMRFA